MTFTPELRFDPHPFARGGSFAICSVSAMHIVQALLILYSPLAINATGLAALFYAFTSIGCRSLNVLSGTMVVTAVLSLMGAICCLGWIRLMIFLPQHFLLGIMAIGGMVAAFHGSYLDGTVKPWEHIAADQFPMLTLFAIHSSAIVRRARDPNG